MAWVPAERNGSSYPDGNDIVYPIANPSDDNKLYVERDISDIAYALGKQLKVSEMADAIETVVESNGLYIFKGSMLYIDMDIQLYDNYHVID